MIELDFGGASNVDQLRNRRIWDGRLRPDGLIEEGEPDA
jgi:hypothetical protein